MFSFTCTQSHSPPPTPTHFHLLSSTPPYSHQLLSTTTHFDPIALISSPLLSIITLFSPLQLIFSPLLLTPTLVLPSPIQFKPTPAMYSLFHSFPVHIQILSPNPTYHLLFQPIFRACVLRAYLPYILRLTYLCACMFSHFTCPCGYVIHFYAL